MDLPLDVVYHIRSFMRWRDCTRMISRDWLAGALRRPVRLRSWRGRVRVYTYLHVFGQAYVRMSWAQWCAQCGIWRRARNVIDRLSWKTAAEEYMRRRCKSCGCRSQSNVMGVCICTRCRFDSHRKYAFMVMTREAKQMGIPKRTLDKIPHHKYRQMRLRFLHDLIE